MTVPTLDGGKVMIFPPEIGEGQDVVVLVLEPDVVKALRNG